MNKIPVFLLFVFLILSSIVVCASASTVKSVPSIPEFTVKLVSNSYTVAPYESIDPYTGKVTTYPSYIAENKSIEITIKNQPFTSVQMPDGNWSHLYYNLRFKGHFSGDCWTYYPSSPEAGYVNASLSEYSLVSLSPIWWFFSGGLPTGSQIDFQVQALIGYDEPMYAGFSTNTPEPVPIFKGYNFTGVSSDWSNTQTLIVPNPSESAPSNTSRCSLPDKTTESEPSQLSSQDSTQTTNLKGSENNPFDLNCGEVAIIALLSIIAVLLVVLIVFNLKKGKARNRL